MKRIGLALVLVVLFASQAFGADHGTVAIGFHDVSKPLGIRWWFNSEQSMALDAAIGFSSREAGEERLNDFGFDLGLPIVMKAWDRVHLMFRPGLMYQSNAQLIGGETESGSLFSILAELEAEVFITDNFSVSASNGFGIFIDSPPGENSESSTGYGTIGSNITDIGFHLYGLWD